MLLKPNALLLGHTACTILAELPIWHYFMLWSTAGKVHDLSVLIHECELANVYVIAHTYM